MRTDGQVIIWPLVISQRRVGNIRWARALLFVLDRALCFSQVFGGNVCRNSLYDTTLKPGEKCM